MSLLSVRGLCVSFGAHLVVHGLDLDLAPGEVLGLVGESGSGKSLSMLALMGLLPSEARVHADTLSVLGQPLLTMPPRERIRMLGRNMAMVFQDALSALNPSYTIGFQIEEVLRLHLGLRGVQGRQRARALLDEVEIPDAETRLRAYPHELSGGMCQRVMIAMALACGPQLLIADEPTTALDVTVQAQILALLQRLQRERGMGLILITHDLGVVAQVAQRVAVMYAGQIVEEASVPQVFERPRHPYTEALLASLPERHRGQVRLPALLGRVPSPSARPDGCVFAPRCPQVQADCRTTQVPWDGSVRCLHSLHPLSPMACGGSNPEMFTPGPVNEVHSAGGHGVGPF